MRYITIGITKYPFLSKVIQQGGTVASQHPPKLWQFTATHIDSLGDMCDVWKYVRQDARKCMLLGAPMPNLAPDIVHRRILKHTPGNPQTLRSLPTQWVILDMDGPELPAGMSRRRAMEDPLTVVRYVRSLLPYPFHETECAWAWSGSMFYRKDRKARLRLAFLTSLPFHPGQVGAWFMKEGAPVDPASFRPAQPIYTAAAQGGEPLPYHKFAGVLYDGKYVEAPLTTAEVMAAVNATATHIVAGGHGQNAHTASAAILSGSAFSNSMHELQDAVLRGGDGLHDALLALSFRMAMSGYSYGDNMLRLQTLMHRSRAKIDTLQRWNERYMDIPRIVSGAYDRVTITSILAFTADPGA